MLAAPNRIGVAAEVIRRTLDGRHEGRPQTGTMRASDRYLLIGPQQVPLAPTRCRPRGSTARWCDGDRRRLSAELLSAAKSVFRPDLYDAAMGRYEAGP